MTSSTSPGTDLWHRYGQSLVCDDVKRGVDGRLFWDWYQRTGPGAEILGELAGRTVVDAGTGNGRQAAHIAEALNAARVIAIDASAGQIDRGREMFGHVARLEFVHADAADHLAAAPDSVDVAYSLFGAADFTDPRTLLPAIATALRPGGTLVIATLAHYSSGQPPETDLRPASIPVRRADGARTTMLRWVLDIPVWEKVLTEAGFGDLTTVTIREAGTEQQKPMATNLFRAVRQPG
ncbi:class I SAM-dependent methyltransferase [Actinacidiphila paucisporea]|uniref:Methyltransferase domain-containing protein n=1 Tax=Actinacidiphila paucisporea TaxID=310782 RepID=A0A1M6YP15_9ACTN|nr:class I SAM-dependent methyltransferase [Actinacidiphila paucisporea]SHL20071.1 Methyltransferase domain-containing protein [Actinacidiphila paucisporea]